MVDDFGSQYDNTTEGREDVFMIVENGQYRIRFISGVKQIARVWIPIVYKNSDDMYETWKAFSVVPGEESIFSAWSVGYKRLQMAEGVDRKSIYSPFDARIVFAYLIFDRSLKELVLQVGEFKPSVRKRLDQLQEMTDPDDQIKLLHGPWWFYDVIVSREINESTRRPQYSVEPYKNKFAGVVPKSYLKKMGNIDPVKKGIITSQEMDCLLYTSDAADE